MLTTRIFAAAAALALSASLGLAQTVQPAKPPVAAPPALTAPALTAPAKPAPAAATPAQPMAAKTNLNTATADQLDGLPDVGKARAKVIMDERAKSRYKNWEDFAKRMEGTSVNAGVQGKIKDLVTF